MRIDNSLDNRRKEECPESGQYWKTNIEKMHIRDKHVISVALEIIDQRELKLGEYDIVFNFDRSSLGIL